MVHHSPAAGQPTLTDDEALELSVLQSTIARQRAKLGITVQQADAYQRPAVARAIACHTAALRDIVTAAQAKLLSATDRLDQSFFREQLFAAQIELDRHLARFGGAS